MEAPQRVAYYVTEHVWIVYALDDIKIVAL